MTVPARMDYLEPAASFICVIAGQLGFDQNDIRSFNLAFEEIFVLIVNSAFGGGSDETVEIGVFVSAASVKITIREKGLPFDISTLREYSGADPEKESSEDGLMVFIAQRSVDEFTYSNHGREGREFILTKHLSNKHIENILSAEELLPYSRPEKAAQKSFAEITVRPLEPKEAIEISRCAYKAYGYTYADYIYYPEKITEMNEKGLMKSLVAATPDGHIMGHVALKYSFAGASVAEICAAFVKPEYRGAGVFDRIVDALLQNARENKTSIFAESVTSHIYSQREAAKHGFSDCALMLAYLPSDTTFKSITEKTSQKESCIVSFLRFAPDERRNIYPPPRHANFIEKIFGAAKIDVAVGDPGNSSKAAVEEPTIIESRKIGTFNVAEIIVNKYGINAEHELRDRLRLYCLEKTDTIFLYLNLSDPATYYFAGEFEKAGFFFSGIIPDYRRGFDAMVLQYLNNVEIDFGKIKINSEIGKLILDYVCCEYSRKI